MDVDYLKQTVAWPLKKAILQTTIVQPVDPIEFMAQYLLSYTKYEKARDLETTVKKDFQTRLNDIHELKKIHNRKNAELSTEEKPESSDVLVENEKHLIDESKPDIVTIESPKENTEELEEAVIESSLSNKDSRVAQDEQVNPDAEESAQDV
ncbi:hypothetical protein ROZALSC1DRAFT_31116 [Rozella allomycis CSF55]|uniref:Uncharacterized protein n=1 Tax=Rozella allomycis (strain CSF55) TaxID=988480 RepID=A0A4V1IZ71_ROZAC|nr:hypothetical protein ROZALSC1DRAFT_31116 [Rozella allomycis CSF55]